MSRITLQELSSRLAERCSMSVADAQNFLSAVLDTIHYGLHEDKFLKIKGLGTFKVIDVKQRKSVDVNTGEEIIIEGREKITFTPDAIMKDLVNKPFSQFETVVLGDGVDFSDFESTISEQDNMPDEKPDVDEMPEETVPEETAEEPKPSDVSDDTPPVQDDSFSEALLVWNFMNSNVKPIESQDENSEETEDVTDEAACEDTSDDCFEEQKPEDADEEDGTQGETIEETVDEEPSAAIPLAVEQEETEESYTESIYETEKNSAWKRWLIAIALIGVSGLLVYYFVSFYNERETVANEQIITNHVMTAKNSSQDKHVADSASQADSLKQASIEKAVEDSITALAIKEKEVKTKPEPKPKPASKPEVKKAEPAKPVAKSETNDKALEYSRRLVQHGAYNIVGTDKVITIKKGQTMISVAKAYLGKDMVCYIEVHNGTTTLKEGQKLKIPKLSLKKKTKR